MDRIRELVKRPLYAAIAGGVLGLILGLIIGWGIWPVQYYDAAPKDMQVGYREDYLRMTIETYAKNGDKNLAMRRWGDLGSDASDLLAKIQVNPQDITPGDLAKFNTLVNAGAAPAPGQTQAAPGATQAAPGGPVATQAPAQPAKPLASPVLLGILCLALLLIGAALVYMFLFRGKGRGLMAARERPEAQVQPRAVEYAAPGQETPIAQFMTTYNAGNDLYDDSFSIDAPSGEFLGECGVGISETIGVGEPKKVTAFEVWLFDKNDIPTVTKVLMSEYAYNDPQIRARLAPKGEPVLIEPGERILLETATLQLEARVVDMAYSQGPLAPNSAFDRLTLELAVWPKPQAAA